MAGAQGAALARKGDGVIFSRIAALSGTAQPFSTPLQRLTTGSPVSAGAKERRSALLQHAGDHIDAERQNQHVEK
ncbi:hypothetical protein ACFPP7_08510 [Polaromonas jejuensis]|uniref:Uncharacterized protein n=1 Tax=Polaromonas jejuensis TaxID=457502 RepID=A0ABW0Q9H6_9BURK